MTVLKQVNTWFKRFNMKFSDPSMEKEYISNSNKNQLTDFQVTILVLVLITLVSFIRSLIDSDTKEIGISAGIIGLLLVILALKRLFSNRISYLILFVIFAYNVYRLAFMVDILAKLSKSALFNSGYTYAILQMILFSHIHNFYYRVWGITACYVLRFGVIIGWIEQSEVDVCSLIQHLILDAFLIYYFYSHEKTSRKFFNEFFLEREELLRFRELLDTDLPQCLAVRDFITKDGLFINKSFANTFSSCEPIHSEPDPDVPEKPFCGALHIDATSLKELGGTRSLDYFKGATTLKDVIVGLTNGGVIEEKTFSLSGSWPYRAGRKTFHIILKKVIWKRERAIVVIMNETTAQEKVNALKAANQHKDTIIATVSHELRTPLNGIIGLLDMAEEKVVHPDAMNYINLSRDNARLLLSLVNSHLDLQQISAGKLRLNPSRIDLAKTINSVIQLLQFQTKQKGIYLEADICKNIPKTIITDENRLKQILINLIGNAIKFTTTGGIKVEVCQDKIDEKCVQISVVDTGMGIKDEDKGKLFQMYGKLEEGRSVNKNGVGLGLIISNVLAILLSGRTDERGIEVESTSGSGSRFYFKIKKNVGGATASVSTDDVDHCKMIEERKTGDGDLETSRKEDEANVMGEELFTSMNLNTKLSSYAHLKRTTMQDVNPNSKTFRSRLADGPIEIPDSDKKGCIIVVDDNPFNLLIVSNLLKELDAPFHTVLGGQEAIELVRSCHREGQPIQAILMDCHMPIMDGYQTTAVLKAMMEKQEIPEAPIFALTAGTSEDEIEKCFASGMKSYLTKPLTKKALLDELAKLQL